MEPGKERPPMALPKTGLNRSGLFIENAVLVLLGSGLYSEVVLILKVVIK